jgi:hypothetical protein
MADEKKTSEQTGTSGTPGTSTSDQLGSVLKTVKEVEQIVRGDGNRRGLPHRDGAQRADVRPFVMYGNIFLPSPRALSPHGTSRATGGQNPAERTRVIAPLLGARSPFWSRVRTI